MAATDAVTEASAPPRATGVASRPRARPWAWSRVPVWAPFLAASPLLYLALLRLNWLVPLNSDQASSTLEAHDMLLGNVLLRGWTLPADTFLTTRVPLLAILEKVQGLGWSAVSESAALTGTAVAVLGTLLAVHGRRGRQAWIGGLVTFALLAVPAFTPGNAGLLPSGTDHAGTVALVLIALLVLDRRPGPWGLVLFGAILTLAYVADPLAFWIGVLGVAGATAIRLIRAEPGWRTDLAVLAATGAAAALTRAFYYGVSLAGGFAHSAEPLGVLKSSAIGGRLALAADALLTLFGADALGLPYGKEIVPPLLHLAGAAAVLMVAAIAIRRWARFQLDRVSQILLAGMAVDLATYLASIQPADIWSARYLVPFLAFGAVLVGREGGRLLTAGRMPVLVCGLAAAYLAIAGGQAISASRAPAPTAEVASWLQANGLTYGLGDYWQSSVITTDTAGAVSVRPVTAQGGVVSPYQWLSNASWYPASGGPQARFVVWDPTGPYLVDSKSLVEAFGPPARTQRIGRFEVMVWDHDLLPDLASPAG